MFDLFKKKEDLKKDDNSLLKVASLLIHVAKVDEEYTSKEKEIIKQAIIELGVEKEVINQFITRAEELETNSNQILDFTKEIKMFDNNFKVKIIEVLWKIIFSNNEEDMYESNLMRRLSGLMYLDKKLVADIKDKIKKNLGK
ncbi:MAG: Tellurite resistance protein TerB [Candidatus Pelagibacter sp. TMED166]|nr:MAG: Tellurite resistance protein TerB [Candidatus Pelagibacter sp. TMED166]|tara:strand:+ start:32549 stop:32974 length:426 start_codon:yes stop_codon:yes gene_type:complete